jgi:hypothetical protein
VTVTAIRETIELAKIHEAKTGHLARMLNAHINSGVHIAIKLPNEGAVDCLMNFVIAYIENVPRFLEAAMSITQSAHIEAYAAPTLNLALDYFLKPPEMISGHIGIDELMDEAYLAHRLMEEVNDRFMLRAGIPLVPMDMTLSNLVVHSLIGEPFSNELDDAVQFSVDKLMAQEHVYESDAFKAYIANHRGDQWQSELERWPCLMDQLSIDLQFSRL